MTKRIAADGEGGYAVDAASEAGSSLFDQSEGEADGVSALGESEVSDGAWGVRSPAVT